MASGLTAVKLLLKLMTATYLAYCKTRRNFKQCKAPTHPNWKLMNTHLKEYNTSSNTPNRKSLWYHFYVNGCTAGCHNGNPRCHQGQQSWHHGNFRFSARIVMMATLPSLLAAGTTTSCNVTRDDKAGTIKLFGLCCVVRLAWWVFLSSLDQIMSTHLSHGFTEQALSGICIKHILP